MSQVLLSPSLKALKDDVGHVARCHDSGCCGGDGLVLSLSDTILIVGIGYSGLKINTIVLGPAFEEVSLSDFLVKAYKGCGAVVHVVNLLYYVNSVRCKLLSVGNSLAPSVSREIVGDDEHVCSVAHTDDRILALDVNVEAFPKESGSSSHRLTWNIERRFGRGVHRTYHSKHGLDLLDSNVHAF